MPIQNPCALLRRLLQEQAEGGWLEFKENNDDPDEIGKYVSALANSAMLAERERAFMVFGVRNHDRQLVGTTVRLGHKKRGGESFVNWLSRKIEPRVTLDLVDFECENTRFALIDIEPSYDRPVKFDGVAYVRVGENRRRLDEFPERERALWLATGRRRFEDAVAASHQSVDDVFGKLDPDTIYELSNLPRPASRAEILRKMVDDGFLIDNLEGGYDVTNLGAILLAREVLAFPSVAGKSIRIVRYIGRDKSRSDSEHKISTGYAVGFREMMRSLMERIPREERYVDGVRRSVTLCPEAAIREVIANALIHQDFTVTGAGPVVEIYDNRIEVTNPGSSLIATDRLIDERRSRNERLAATMRAFGLCEERGGGLDKSLLEIERAHLPAPDFISSPDSMRVVLFGPRPFSQISKTEKIRAVFFHCVLRWLTHDYMSNSTLRERFSLPQEEYQAVSVLIGEAVRMKRIAPADPAQGRRNAKYVPYWAA